ncbi:MAG: aminotransferase class I/II-fold pyridoxal phosphate-dependent enzyme [Peptococcaceae bacterium]|nr:aminotransferase class I/II-fold pyridoxal phosphate-dependent enzyme [Peptococcaceae bacterium]
MKTPLWTALSAHVAKAAQSTHTPGHKSGRLIPAALREAWGEAVWHYDLTELPGLDNLAHPEEVLAASMAEWAKDRSVAHVQYLLGGSSLGLKAAMLALCRGEKVFVPRHAHHSIYEGLALAGAAVVPLEVCFDEALGIPLGVAPETLAAACEAHPDCRRMVLVHPTYHGITWQNEALVSLARQKGVLTIADSAHGAHFTSTFTPPSALALGAEVAVESAHKTLPCLTQASILLVREEALVAPLVQAVALLHTTSPSYLLMASLEQAGAWLANEGEAVMEVGVQRIAALEERFAQNAQHMHIMRKKAWRQDPFKLYLHCAHASGETLAQLLAAEGVDAEMADGSGCLLMLGLDGVDAALEKALFAVDAALAQVQEPLPAPCYLQTPPERVVSLADAWLAPRRTLPLSEAVGEVAAALVEAYPPGIPLVLPGERITEAVVQAWTASGRPAERCVEVLDKR